MLQLCSLIVLLFAVQSYAQPQFFDGHTLKKVTLSEVADRVHPGTIIVFGEIHDSEIHHQNQRDLLVSLTQRKSVLALSVGMEFIDYTQQNYLDSFLNGQMDETEFLDAIAWGGTPFEHYRFQVKLPPYRQGWTYGINLPRRITGKVSQSGLESLSPDEQKLLPPDFELGSEDYFERFEATMKGHVPDEAIQRYFISQSLWDDTMAWRTQVEMTKNPNQSFVIMVGDFHAAFGHGLSDRLIKRGAQDVLVISQVHSVSELGPHPKYGARGDFVFVSNESSSEHVIFNELIKSLTYRH